MLLLFPLQGREVPEAIQQAAAGVSAGLGGEGESLKKLYFKVVRAIHPDKVLDAPEDVRFEYQRVFTVLTEAYKKHQEAPATAGTGAGKGGPGVSSATGSSGSKGMGGTASAASASASAPSSGGRASARRSSFTFTTARR